VGRRHVLFLLPVCVTMALVGSLSINASAANPDDHTGPRDLKSMPWAQPAHDHNHDSPDRVAAMSTPVQAAAAATCVNGLAGEFPCRNVDLLSNLPLSSMGGGNGSAGWGWTDPATGKEYAIVGRTTGASFVDISNPTTPVFLGDLPTATGTSSWREVNVHNNHAYIVSDNNGAHGLQIFDLTRLRGITTPQTFTADARNTSFSNAHTIHINNATGIAYVNGSNTCSGGPRMFNLATPTNPAFVGCVSGDGYTHDAQAVVYHGPDAEFQNREILVASNEDTVTVWDVTTKSSPVQLARKTYTGRGYTHQGWFTEDHHFFLLDDETDETNFGHNTRTYVWDMSSLRNPVLIGNFTGPTPATDHNQFVKGNFSYQATYRAGLRILDLTNIASPSTMTEAGFFDVDPTSNANGFAGAWQVYPFFPSGNVAIFSIQRGLFVVHPNLTTAPPPNTVFSDTFETSLGWTTNPNGTDTATTGRWERGDPEQTTSTVTLQLGTTTSGVNDLVTGRLAGASAGENDVDGGTTTIQSPTITLPSTGTLTLTFSWYLAHLSNATADDFLRVQVIGGSGTTTQVFQQLGAATNRAGSWATATVNLTGFAGQTIRLRILAADAGTASLVEAGIDDVKIVQQT
jgi:choice-of-anchor B domain-containing protein